jgi:hypothetical protein
MAPAMSAMHWPSDQVGPAGASYASVADADQGATVAVLTTPWQAMRDALAVPLWNRHRARYRTSD